MNTYERSVAAALQETGSKFKLAEALALDIPKAQGQDGVVTKALTKVAEAIITAGGEPRHHETLRRYRACGLWALRDVNVMEFGWADGYSFTSHMEAMAKGIAHDTFIANTKTVREIRQENGAASKDGAPANVIAGWSEDQKAEARQKLMEDAVEKIVAEQPMKLPPIKKGDKPKAEQVQEQAEHRKLAYAIAEVMHFSRSTIQRAKSATAGFNEAMPSTWWEKGFPGESRNRTHEEQVLGDLDKAIEALHAMRIDVARIIDNAKVAR